MPATRGRQITLRLPKRLYDRVKQLARKRRVSMNRLAQEGLEALAQAALAQEMRAAYDALGADADETDMEPFLAAQREVVEREPIMDRVDDALKRSLTLP